MKCYKIKIDISKLRTYPISKAMTNTYDYGKYNSVYNLKSRGKLDFIPDFNSIDLINSANPKKLDLISSVPIAGSGIIISNKLLDVIKEFTLPKELQIFDVNAVHKGVDYHYNYFYIYDTREYEVFNFENNLFITTQFGFPESDYYELNYEELKRRMLEEYQEITPKEVLLNHKKIKSDIFALDLTKGGYYVSEKLKQAIEDANCQGIEFIPIEELNYTMK